MLLGFTAAHRAAASGLVQDAVLLHNVLRCLPCIPKISNVLPVMLLGTFQHFLDHMTAQKA